MTRPEFYEEWQLLLNTREWFDARGYALVETRGPEGMNQGFDVYVGKSVAIRIIADRGQWFIEVHPQTEGPDAARNDGWFSLEPWSTCLGSLMLFHDPSSAFTDADRVAVLANSWWLRPQLDFLRDHLEEIEAMCAPDQVADTITCLVEAESALRRSRPGTDSH